MVKDPNEKDLTEGVVPETEKQNEFLTNTFGKQPSVNAQELAKMYEIFGGAYQGSGLQRSTYKAQQEAQNQYAQNMAQSQLTAMDAIRRANASSIASGANAGLAAANQLSAILGLQEESVEGATGLANTLMRSEVDNEKWMREQWLRTSELAGNLVAGEAQDKQADINLYTEQSQNIALALSEDRQKLSKLTVGAMQEGNASALALGYSLQLLEIAQTAPLAEQAKYLELVAALRLNPTNEMLNQVREVTGIEADQIIANAQARLDIESEASSKVKSEKDYTEEEWNELSEEEQENIKAQDAVDLVKRTNMENTAKKLEDKERGILVEFEEAEDGTRKIKLDIGTMDIDNYWSEGSDWNFVSNYVTLQGETIERPRKYTNGIRRIKGQSYKLPDGTSKNYSGKVVDIELEYARDCMRQYEKEINNLLASGNYTDAQNLLEKINDNFTIGSDGSWVGRK